MSRRNFELRPRRQRLQEEPEVVERVDWRTLRTAGNDPISAGAGEPAPSDSGGEEPDAPAVD